MANEILMMKVRQCVKDLNTLKHVFSKSEENESKYAEIKNLVIDVLLELASDVPDKSKVEFACANLKNIAQEYNDAGDNLDVKKAAGSFAAKVALLKNEDYGDFLTEILKEDKNDAIKYLLKDEEVEMSSEDLEKEAWNAYYTSKDYEKALKYANQAIEKGSLFAYYVLGAIYGDKTWNKYDVQKSYQYYKEGAVKGQADCQFQLYIHLLQGIGVPENSVEGYTWLEKAADGEHPLAMTVLGKFFCHQSMARYTEAFQLFEKAADKDSEEAKAWIGHCYEKGYGVGRDVNRAKAIYQQEMSRGNILAKEFYDKLLDKEWQIAEENRKREEQRRRDEERRRAEENRRREEQRRREEEQRRRDEERRRIEARRRKEEEERKKKRNIGCGCILVLLLLGLLWAGYEFWFKDYMRDMNAPRTYVYATNLFLRSSKDADSESNRIGKIPYGAEVVTYSNQNDWAEVKFDGETGYVSSDYLLSYDDFRLLDGVWGNEEAKEVVMTSKCRRAILDFLKYSNWKSGADAWQIYTKAKEIQPNSVLYPSLNDGYSDFSEFAFILTNNQTKKRKLVLYAFEKDESPILRHLEDAPDKGDIKSVSYSKWNNKYRVVYSGQSVANNAPQTDVKPKTEVKGNSKDLSIENVSFANVDYNNKVIDSFGAQLYQDTKYLKPKVNFKKTTSETEKFRLQVKIFWPNGNMLRGSTSPSYCTFEQEVTLKGENGNVVLKGWGDNGGNVYKYLGTYTYEIWHNGKKISSTSLPIQKRPQTTTDKPVATTTDYDNVIFERAEQMPLFPGGSNAMMKYLQKNLRYPAAASENGIEGRVTVSFVIEKDGSISNATVVKGVNSSLDREALRVVLAMPKWKPAMIGDRKVRFKYTIPVNFKLN